MAGQRRHAGLAPLQRALSERGLGATTHAVGRGGRRTAAACNRHPCAPAAPQGMTKSREDERCGEKETTTSNVNNSSSYRRCGVRPRMRQAVRSALERLRRVVLNRGEKSQHRHHQYCSDNHESAAARRSGRTARSTCPPCPARAGVAQDQDLLSLASPGRASYRDLAPGSRPPALPYPPGSECYHPPSPALPPSYCPRLPCPLGGAGRLPAVSKDYKARIGSQCGYNPCQSRMPGHKCWRLLPLTPDEASSLLLAWAIWTSTYPPPPPRRPSSACAAGPESHPCPPLCPRQKRNPWPHFLPSLLF